MSIDPSKFHLINVVDTCAVWNLLSSKVLYSNAKDAGCDFCMTEMVKYECLIKKRSKNTLGEQILKERLLQAQSQGSFKSHSVDIADIQNVVNLRQRMGKGEVSTIAFALKINQAVLTDDQKARILASDAGCRFIQTTPHLLSWLIFNSRLGDVDVSNVVVQHEEMEGTLKKYFHDSYMLAIECRSKI